MYTRSETGTFTRMERMNRNGLFALVAVLLALALTICLKNTVYAQITYYDRFIEMVPDPITGDPVPILRTELRLLGNTVTINVHGTTGDSIITAPDYALDGTPMYGKRTNAQDGTVFWNYQTGGLGVITSPAFINAGSRTEISTTSTAPAIRNGFNNQAAWQIERRWEIEIVIVGGTYQIHYFAYDVDASGNRIGPNVPYPANEDNMPEALWDHDNLTWYGTYAELDPEYVFWNNITDTPYEAGFLPQGHSGALPTRERGVEGWVAGPTIPGPGASPPDRNETSAGELGRGDLSINAGTPRHEGENRTLIRSEGTAIINIGTLTVNHSRIQAGYYDELSGWVGGVGIEHEYARAVTNIINSSGDIIGIRHWIPEAGDNVILNNTQIGSPGYEIFEGWYYGIPVDQNGTPVQTTTRISAGDKIMSEGVNGRIEAGRNVTLSRNTFGDMYGYGINGPAIGVHAWAHALVEFYGPRMENICSTSLYIPSQVMPGMFDSGYYLGGVGGQIQLNDNSWIFAQTGISFGNTHHEYGFGDPCFH